VQTEKPQTPNQTERGSDAWGCLIFIGLVIGIFAWVYYIGESKNSMTDEEFQAVVRKGQERKSEAEERNRRNQRFTEAEKKRTPNPETQLKIELMELRIRLRNAGVPEEEIQKFATPESARRALAPLLNDPRRYRQP
jgi:hypothetical protein